MDILKTLGAYEYQLIETLVVLILYVMVRFSINFAVKRRMMAQSFGQDRMYWCEKS